MRFFSRDDSRIIVYNGIPDFSNILERSHSKIAHSLSRREGEGIICFGPDTWAIRKAESVKDRT